MNSDIAMVYAMLHAAMVEQDGAPAGIKYAALMTQGVDAYKFERLVAAMVSAGLVEQRHHVVHVTDKGRALVSKLDTALKAASAV